jgi:hypothetical protein
MVAVDAVIIEVLSCNNASMQQRRLVYLPITDIRQRYRRSSSSGCVHRYGVISRPCVNLIM